MSYTLWILNLAVKCRCHNWGTFRGGTRENAVQIIEKLSERIGTAFPLLECSITPTMHQIAVFCIYNLPIFPRVIPPDPYPVLGSRHQFSLGSPAIPFFLFHIL